jgi:hypothetical protein
MLMKLNRNAERERVRVHRVAHPVTGPVAGANCMVENRLDRGPMPAGNGHGWPSFGVGKNGVSKTVLRVNRRARLRAHHEVLQMAKRKEFSEDAMIAKARTHADQMLNRLVEIANAEPSSHVSVKAAETVIRLAREKTEKERDPLNIEGWFNN